MSNVCCVQCFLCPVFFMSSVCYVQFLLCPVFVCQGLSCPVFVCPGFYVVPIEELQGPVWYTGVQGCLGHYHPPHPHHHLHCSSAAGTGGGAPGGVRGGGAKFHGVPQVRFSF